MSDLTNFHRGEVQMQAAAGVDSERFDAMVTEAFRPELSHTERRFVSERTFSVAASIDTDRRPWASPLFGKAGELFDVVDPTTVRIAAPDTPGDPLRANVAATGELGVLYFDPSRRRRAKSLGSGVVGDDGTLTYRMTRNFGLCNKYIFKRSHEPAAGIGVISESKRAGVGTAVQTSLAPQDADQLKLADTVFLASHHHRHGADATHRGGPSGFVGVAGPRTISLPDYVGNGMFQTLGNLLLDDRIGLTSIDFASGRTLHITGRGSVVASPDTDPMSVRTVRIHIDEVRVSQAEVGTWTDIEAFDLQPGLINPATPHLR